MSDGQIQIPKNFKKDDKLIAAFNYQAREEDEVNLSIGEEITFINYTNVGASYEWSLVKKGDGIQGLVPSTYIYFKFNPGDLLTTKDGETVTFNSYNDNYYQSVVKNSDGQTIKIPTLELNIKETNDPTSEVASPSQVLLETDEKDEAKKITGKKIIFNDNDIFPIVFENSMSGGALKFNDKEIKNDTNSNDKKELLIEWDQYVNSMLTDIGNEYFSYLEEDNSKNFKFVYISELDTLSLLDISKTTNLESWDNDFIYYEEDKNNYIPEEYRNNLIIKLVPWIKVNLSIDLLFNTLYDYQTLAESWNSLNLNLLIDAQDEKNTLLPDTNIDQVNTYLTKIYDFCKNMDDSYTKRLLFNLAKIKNNSEINSKDLLSIEWKQMKLLLNLRNIVVQYDSEPQSEVDNMITAFIIINLLTCVCFIQIYNENFNANNEYTNNIDINRITEKIQNVFNVIWGSVHKSGSDSVPTFILKYYDTIVSHIIEKYHSDGLIKKPVHECLKKISALVKIFQIYDKESDLLGLLFFSNANYMKEIRGDSVFNHKGEVKYKYEEFWHAHAFPDQDRHDPSIINLTYSTPSNEKSNSEGGKGIFFKKVKELNKILTGKEELPQKDRDISMLASIVNSGFVDTEDSKNSDDLDEAAKSYKMFEYNIKNDTITIRSFDVDLIINSGSIITFNRKNNEPNVEYTSPVDDIGNIFEDLKLTKRNKLLNLKFDDSLKNSLKKNNYDDDKFYLLGYVNDEDYVDNILTQITNKNLPQGGYKQKGGLSKNDVKKWADEIKSKLNPKSNNQEKSEKRYKISNKKHRSSKKRSKKSINMKNKTIKK